MRAALKRQNRAENIYLPVNGRIEEVRKKTEDVSLFRVSTPVSLSYKPGQFFMVSVWGAGEVPISTASLCEDGRVVEFCVRRAGAVTGAIHCLREGGGLWLRGPYGNGFAFERKTNEDVLIVAGGIGIAPLRPIIHMSKKDGPAGRVMLLYGSKTPQDVVFMDEVQGWKSKGIDVVLTVDRANSDWKGHVGLVTDLWHKVQADFSRAAAYICGPEIMIKSAMRDLSLFGMADEKIITTLEAHMKCGVGKCGHCYSGPKYICTDGPVFSYKEIKEYSLLG